ncbi:MAG TPA: hypothetical protein VLT88_09020 [Desulfosarcina sp.]|nr:hypothetical protein [Desulfosarcina sp.]
MPLTTFGAILNFAESLENADMQFYTRAAAADGCAAQADFFAKAAAESGKNISLVQRTRRENVTEMILEPIQGLTRGSYQTAAGDAAAMDCPSMLAASVALEERAIRYYGDAADKIRALPEVSRVLKTLAKKRVKRLDRIRGMAG